MSIIKSALCFVTISLFVSFVSTCETISYYSRGKEHHVGANCSNSNLNWKSINDEHLGYIFPSKSLILSYNSFWKEYTNENPIERYCLRRFYQLSDELILSHNSFDFVDELAFFTSKTYGYITDTIYPLNFSLLDLSHNNLTTMPFNSLKYLTNLTVLIVNSNPIKSFDIGDFDLNDNEELQSKLKYKLPYRFANLTEIYANSSEIETIDPSVLQEFKSLKVLDLSNNKIKHLSFEIYNILYGSKIFKDFFVTKNPLICDCKLLWLKYLFKHLYGESNYNAATCIINTKPEIESSQVGSKSIVVRKQSLLGGILDGPNKFLYDLNNIKTGSLSSNYTNSSSRTIKLSDLDDKMFICEMNISCITLKVPDNKFRIECITYSYPSVTQKWLLFDKDITKLANENNAETVKIKTEYYEKFEYRGLDIPFVYKQEFLADYHETNLETGSYSYKVSLSGDGKIIQSAKIPTKTFTFYVQNDYYIPKLSESRNNETVLAAALNTPTKSFLYWLVLALCVLFAILVIIYVLLCILIRRQKNSKMEIHRRSFYDNYTTSNSDYSSLNRKNPIYVSARSSSSRGNYDNIIRQQLKPDTIREHQECNSIYSNLNNSKYINLLFKTPSTPGRRITRFLDFNNNSMNSNIYYNNSDTSNSETNLVKFNSRRKYDQASYDRYPVESTLLNDPDGVELTSLSNSSKSFDENIEEYLDPEFDDLRKPEQKAQQEQQKQETG
jgi:Leucine-rich repeat (LRR) protein